MQTGERHIQGNAEGASAALELRPDERWKDFEERLYRAAREALADFAARHGDEEACCFAFDSDPESGAAHICLDTVENSQNHAARDREWARRRMSRPGWRDRAPWERAVEQLRGPGLAPFANTWDFKYPEFREVRFDGREPEVSLEESLEEQRVLREALRREAAPHDAPQFASAAEETEFSREYAAGNLALVFWRVAERLLAEGQFDGLRRSRPFLVGFNLQQFQPVTLRIL